VLTVKIIEPELNSWILLLLILGIKAHVLLHVLAHLLENFSQDLCFSFVLIQPFKIVDHRWNSFDNHGSHELLKLLFESWTCLEQINCQTGMGVALWKYLFVLSQNFKSFLVISQSILGFKNLAVVCGIT
jgi:hypothetical protein